MQTFQATSKNENNAKFAKKKSRYAQNANKTRMQKTH